MNIVITTKIFVTALHFMLFFTHQANILHAMVFQSRICSRSKLRKNLQLHPNDVGRPRQIYEMLIFVVVLIFNILNISGHTDGWDSLHLLSHMLPPITIICTIVILEYNSNCYLEKQKTPRCWMTLYVVPNGVIKMYYFPISVCPKMLFDPVETSKAES